MTLTREQVDALSEIELRRLWGLIMRRIGTPERKGKHVAVLTALSVGESYTIPGKAWSANLTTAKHAARRRLDAPDAQWATRTTNKGLRVTRVR